MTSIRSKTLVTLFLAASVHANASQPTATANSVTGTATSKSQGFTESFVSIGGNATANQSATAPASGTSNVTGTVTNNFAEVVTKAEQISAASATGNFQGQAGPSEFSPFSNAGAFSFSSAEGVATIPTITAPGNSGNAGNSGNNGGGN
jgi:hypothetical protein